MKGLDVRMANLERANEVRVRQAELKRALKRRELDARELLAAPPAEVLKMRVGDFLKACPAVGKTKALSIPRRMRMSPTLRLSQLPTSRRLALAAELPVRGERRAAA